MSMLFYGISSELATESGGWAYHIQRTPGLDPLGSKIRN